MRVRCGQGKRLMLGKPENLTVKECCLVNALELYYKTGVRIQDTHPFFLLITVYLNIGVILYFI